jgi:hypothetical protein
MASGRSAGGISRESEFGLGVDSDQSHVNIHRCFTYTHSFFCTVPRVTDSEHLHAT